MATEEKRKEMTLDQMSGFSVGDDRELLRHGQKVVTEQRHRLQGFERFLAGVASASAAMIAVVEVGRSIGWWGG